MITTTFFIASLIVILIPGSGVLYTVSTGMTGSRKSSFFAAVGCTLGIIPHLTISILGLLLIRQMNSAAFSLIKWIGAIYLLYLGLGMILSKTGLTANEEITASPPLSIILKGIFINLLNPKLTLFFFSYLPQFIVNGDNSTTQSLQLGIFFMLLTLIIFMLYGILAGSFSELLKHSPKICLRIQQIFGAVFIIFAMQLAFF
ncbi:LysE family translocator [Acetobacterium tundrae]|uniref:LysE family translocator n=1 Tax=Acetobacterium tundrae TaxID=132932 RepID=A0ABR6WPG3_9FIRM|nr:LysE family translocator [Acetobacterium tundrae]MBC3798392.1 LysE family translocator [Acetobacterium tundrae]